MTRYPDYRRPKTFLWFALTLFAGISASAFAEEIEYLPAEQSYDATIPTPASALGYEPGVWHVRHDQLVSYMRALASTSSRVELLKLGQTYEDRTLLQLTISSPENLARIDDIKAAHKRLASSDNASVDIDDLPVMVSLNYSIHGNEPSGTNAALLVAYYLAAAKDAAITGLLDDVVVVLNPALNPDGLSFFATWVNYHKSKNLVAHPISREHTAPWPAGRMNHYFFNLNRDWLFLQQRETQLFVQQTRDWMPHIFADFHETGSDTSAYFQPGVPTRIHPFTSTRNQELTAKLAEFSAAAYDEQGLLYYTKERFDDFYHGKSSTYGDVIGSIGLTFEVGSSRGHLKESINGPLSFPLTIKKQIITSLSVLAGAQQLRTELLDYQAEYFESARTEAEQDRVKLYVVGDNGDPQRLREFSKLLLRQGIDVFRLSRRVDADGIGYLPGAAIAVPATQNTYRIIKSLFERRTEYVEPVFYDVSAWNAPMAFNLPFTTMSSDRGLIGGQIEMPVPPAANSNVSESGTGYIFSWQDLRAPWTLNCLLENGVHARVATKPLSLMTDKGARSFERGSIVVPVQPQQGLKDSLHEIVQGVCNDSSVPVFSVVSGLAKAGVDLGSSSLKPIAPVRALLLGGEGMSRTEVGEVWYVLDQRVDMAVPIVDIANFPDVDLSDFTHLILVNGKYDALNEHIVSIQDWVRTGGTLILQRDAAMWAQENVLDENATATSEIAVTGADNNSDISAGSDSPSPRPYAMQEVDIRSEKIAGAILHVDIDDSHPIGFGYGADGVSVMRQGTQVLPVLANPYSYPGRYSESPLLSGYVSDKNIEQLGGTAAIAAHKLGEGLIVSFADNPNFRAYFYGSSKLFLNALFFSSAVDYVD